MGKVENIRRVADAPPVRAPRSPERDALALAIARDAAMAASITRAREAKGKAEGLWLRADNAIDAAKAHLRDLKDTEPRRLIDRLMGEGTDESDEIGEATAALAKAEADATTARQAVTILDGEIRELEKRRELTRMNASARRGEVLRAEVRERLVAEITEARQRYDTLFDALSVVDEAAHIDHLQGRWRGMPVLGRLDRPPPCGLALRAWIEALATDADAPLPAILLPSGDRPAPDAA